MLQGFVLTLREGLEALLVVAVGLAYLRATGHRQLVSAVHVGIAASVIASGVAGMLLRRTSNEALWEGTLAIAAAVPAAAMLMHLWRTARGVRSGAEPARTPVARSGRKKAGTAAFLGVLLSTVLVVVRGGMEASLLLGAALFQLRSAAVFAGMLGGLAAAAAVAWLWTTYARRMSLPPFLQVTAIFLVVFLVQLLAYGFHELTEANVLPYSEPLHWATEPYGPDGRYGRFLTYALVLLPLGWLAFRYPGRVRHSVSDG